MFSLETFSLEKPLFAAWLIPLPPTNHCWKQGFQFEQSGVQSLASKATILPECSLETFGLLTCHVPKCPPINVRVSSEQRWG